MRRIRSFFDYRQTPSIRMAQGAINVLDALERALQREEPLLARATPPDIVRNALNRLVGNDEGEDVIVYPLRSADDLEMNWTNDLGQRLSDLLLDELAPNPLYAEWERSWGESSLATDLAEMTMRSPSVRNLQEATQRQIRHSLDQSLYHLLGFYLGSIAAGRSRMLSSLDIVCRHMTEGVPLGRSEEHWTGWMIAGH